MNSFTKRYTIVVIALIAIAMLSIFTSLQNDGFTHPVVRIMTGGSQ